MAKKASNNSSEPVIEVNDQKNRKKQAKKEAKMMLEIEEAKSSIQKAEKSLAKAQARLEASNTHLRTLEAELSEFRTPHEQVEVSAPDTGFDHQNGQPELGEETIISAQNGNIQQQV
jgi:chromosome segregation ATPase